jgi:signal peptidase II
MKIRSLILLILTILIADQALKIYIKLNYLLHQSTPVFGDWFQLYFVENPGMAYGWKFGGTWGKAALTLFRLGAVIFGTWYLGRIIRMNYHKGFVFCAGLIYAGAAGNLIDSCFYGLIFDKGMIFDPAIREYLGYSGHAVFSSNGYASFLHGNVVDMLYFPILRGHFPQWVPGWGGEYFEFFRPIFNIADASITCGVLAIIVFQNKLLHRHKSQADAPAVETAAPVDDTSQVS